MKRKPIVAFIGIDGAGKTTLIEQVGKKFKKDGDKYKVVYMGLGSNQHIPFLKTAMKLYARIRYGKNRENPKNRKWDNYRERNPFWVLVQFTEFWIRYLRFKGYSKEYIIFFDRFFHDGLILGNPISFHIFRFFTPKIDKCFVISAPPEVIYGRKKEAGIKDIIKYYKKAKKLSHYLPMMFIDNTKPLKEVTGKIYREIKKIK